MAAVALSVSQDADAVSHVFFSEPQRNYDYVWQSTHENTTHTNIHGGKTWQYRHSETVITPFIIKLSP